ncbi:hypothetical protein EDD18DRAFT_1103555 [Armillaria luteobubalina]|uniref:F-box domain-containing protein n=1 Tax=Armillaria luteobubalina TaxID=153913 RepID=A0AA39QCQ7_9AGAR|nr:hypothetical protein EDD18DRAFT_1103555 [Armillaria luteobubalina]
MSFRTREHGRNITKERATMAFNVKLYIGRQSSRGLKEEDYPPHFPVSPSYLQRRQVENLQCVVALILGRRILSWLSTMASVPPEIVEQIIDHVAEDDSELRKSSLANCALVTKLWLPRAQYHMFRVTELRTRTELRRFAELCRNGSFVAHNIEHLTMRLHQWLSQKYALSPIFAATINLSTITLKNFHLSSFSLDVFRPLAKCPITSLTLSSVFLKQYSDLTTMLHILGQKLSHVCVEYMMLLGVVEQENLIAADRTTLDPEGKPKIQSIDLQECDVEHWPALFDMLDLRGLREAIITAGPDGEADMIPRLGNLDKLEIGHADDFVPSSSVAMSAIRRVEVDLIDVDIGTWNWYIDNLQLGESRTEEIMLSIFLWEGGKLLAEDAIHIWERCDSVLGAMKQLRVFRVQLGTTHEFLGLGEEGFDRFNVVKQGEDLKKLMPVLERRVYLLLTASTLLTSRCLSPHCAIPFHYGPSPNPTAKHFGKRCLELIPVHVRFLYFAIARNEKPRQRIITYAKLCVADGLCGKFLLAFSLLPDARLDSHHGHAVLRHETRKAIR